MHTIAVVAGRRWWGDDRPKGSIGRIVDRDALVGLADELEPNKNSVLENDEYRVVMERK